MRTTAHPSKPTIILSSVVLVLTIAGMAAGIRHATSSHHAAAPRQHSTVPSHAAAAVSAQTRATAKTAAGSPASSSTSGSAPVTGKPAAAGNQPFDACKALTADIARQLLGAGAKTVAADTADVPPAISTDVSGCAYTSGSSGVQLVVRTATNDLGAAENDTIFGSGRPTKAVRVSGYGQSAFWDPAKHQLNILSRNNWYAVTRTVSGRPGGQSDTEAAAKLIAPGL